MNPDLPTATPVMGPYGTVSAYSTEKQVAAKGNHSGGLLPLYVNAEGVIQTNSISTRGMAMLGGPTTYTSPTQIHAATDNIFPTPPSLLVDGFILAADGATPIDINLPGPSQLNQFLNPALITGGIFENGDRPRTRFTVTVAGNTSVRFITSAIQPAGYAAGRSGYQEFRQNIPPADCSYVNVGLGVAVVAINSSGSEGGAVTTVHFVQVTGPDPNLVEWLIVGNRIVTPL